MVSSSTRITLDRAGPVPQIRGGGEEEAGIETGATSTKRCIYAWNAYREGKTLTSLKHEHQEGPLCRRRH